MNPKIKYILYLFLLLVGVNAWASWHTTSAAWHGATAEDSVYSRFPVAKTAAVSEDDLKKKTLDLKAPDNIKPDTVYDAVTNTYVIGKKVGDGYLSAPVVMTAKEYQEWTLRKSLRDYYRQKNEEEFDASGKKKFDFTDMHFDLGPAEKIFGPGGVQIKTQGSAELKVGANMRHVQNPSIALNKRKTFGFDFDENINMSLKGSVGDKINMNLNYNTEATFDMDAQNLKLKYEGKEDEIIKLIEAGDVSLPSNSSLIQGSSALFGIRTDLQFGKLKLQTVVSQKKSSSKSVSSKGGVQLHPFEFTAVDYEENRHYFLAHFFRDRYDQNMKSAPTISSGITIKRVELWVTNKTGNTENNRNIVAFTDLGETDKISNPNWSKTGEHNPQNRANTLYESITGPYAAARNISQTTQVLDAIPDFEGGDDYEKLQSARKLNSSEYKVNEVLGYVSLNFTLQSDEVLAVAFEYTYNGQTYQVGEFSTDLTDNAQALYVKALKNTAVSPSVGNWDLMMKNVYSLNATTTQAEKFKLDIKYQSDSAGVYLNYLPEERLKGVPLLRIMNLDRLDAKNNPYPNGQFDYLEGYTISRGRIYFPVVEPFGNHLRNYLKDESLADRYCFQELYDSTKTVARQIAEKNKYQLTGEYKGNNGAELDLGAMNIPQGSVVVTAGGVTLTENTDYTVDYSLGRVTIINQNIIDAGTNVTASYESNEFYGMQRKTMLGMNLQYDFSKDFVLGGTLMYLNEQPLTSKVNMGEEPLRNTLWGLNMSWKHESQWLTNLLDKIPFLECTAPSMINFTGEFAQLIAGQNHEVQGSASYIDDFESAESAISILQPTAWMISSVPSDFEESKWSNDVRAGYNRALMSWYYVDPIFTRRNSTLTPGHIKNDLEQLSNHYVREVYERELYPNKSQNSYTTSVSLPVMNIAYYPAERGPYNLNPELDFNGRLQNKSKNWGGMMRRLDVSDFETSNIEYIEFWMLDPFIYTREQNSHRGGDFYINLGEVSEDVLKDGKKFVESAMPIDGNLSYFSETVWGRVPNTNSITYAFNNESGAREKQDVGLNGLNSTEERNFGAYKEFLTAVQGKVSAAVFDSLLNDPAGDDFHYFRGTDFDNKQLSILERYKRINLPEGNSRSAENSPESYDTSYKTTPDGEDINQDYTLNEYERYYQYRISIRPEDLVVGKNYVVDKRHTSVPLRNGKTEEVDWYLFRIPVDQYQKKVGNINDFTSIRFIRMYLTDFEKPIVMRMATLDLVQGQWRTYEQSLYNGDAPAVNGTLDVSAVNIEENASKTPVNYVVPPGITRVVDPSQSQLAEANEQALSMVVKNLGTGDARAIYKNMNLDMRRYRHLQMFVHANAVSDDFTDLEDNQMSVFIRLGSDYKNNFYEYEIPLKLTPEGKYSTMSTEHRRLVWPADNMLDIDLGLLTGVKKNRNRAKSQGLIAMNQLYAEYDPERPNNKVSIVGNPSLGEVKTIMVGIRNNAGSTKSAEVWINELRMQEFTNDGGWAAQGNLNVQLSDIGNVALQGQIMTAGFGGLEQSVSERKDEDSYHYSITTSLELGRFLPEKVKLSMPLYYSYSKEVIKPKYNPLDTDMLLEDALASLTTGHERDSLTNLATSRRVNQNFSLSNVRVDIATPEHPMPYDPANFSFNYAHSSTYSAGETTAWETEDRWTGGLSYSYSPSYKPFEPFKKRIKSKSKWFDIVRNINLNYLPQNVSFNTDMTRNYYEFQERDIHNLENSASLPLSFAQDFLWNRDFSIRWDLTKALHLSFNSATRAEIEEPYTPVNKDLYPDAYSAWKDSVWHSIKGLGRPLDYQQNFSASYKLPLSQIPCFDWIDADGSYSANYSWVRGVEMEDGSSLGNTINSTRDVNVGVRLNMERLYNHSEFLKKANQRFSRSGRIKASNERKKKQREEKRQEEIRKKQMQEKAKLLAEGKLSKDSIETITNAKGVANAKKKTSFKGFSKEITLYPDSQLIVKHNQKSKKIRVTAVGENGKRYELKYKKIDQNTIRIKGMDSLKVRLNVMALPKADEKPWYVYAQGTARFLMMVRNVSLSYRNNYSMALPGFLPNAGDVFGQCPKGGLQPGLDFAFGMINDSYIEKANRNGWLLNNDSVSSPAVTSTTEDFQLKITLEPVPDLKIDLNASRSTNRNSSIQYMYRGMPSTQSGSFNMTTISIGSAFEKGGSATNGYSSNTFAKFRNLLDVYQKRVEQQYIGATYPSGTGMNGVFNPENGTVSKYSSDVMIPAFLSAYTGSNHMDIFPSLWRMLPNWSVSYRGLSSLPWIKDHFRSVTLNHAYRSVYSVGAYNTYSSWLQYMGDLGFVSNTVEGGFLPSSMYDVSSVSINESFSPLIGVNVTLKNNMTFKAEYKRVRVLSLSMTSVQLNESSSDDIVFGFGYQLDNFNVASLFGRRNRNRSHRTSDKDDDKPVVKSGFNRQLNLRFDFSYRNQNALTRDIQNSLSEATSGNRAVKTSFSADYTLSKYMTFTLYYDRQRNIPLLSSNAYPTITQDFGFSLRFSLTR